MDPAEHRVVVEHIMYVCTHDGQEVEQEAPRRRSRRAGCCGARQGSGARREEGGCSGAGEMAPRLLIVAETWNHDC